MFIHSYTIGVGGNRVGWVSGIDNERRRFTKGKEVHWSCVVYSGVHSLSISAYWPLWTCLPAPLYCFMLGSYPGGHEQESAEWEQGRSQVSVVTFSGLNSGSSCISPMTPLPIKLASHSPASTYPVNLAHNLTLGPSHSSLLTIFQIAAFFHLGFSALPLTV